MYSLLNRRPKSTNINISQSLYLRKTRDGFAFFKSFIIILRRCTERKRTKGCEMNLGFGVKYRCTVIEISELFVCVKIDII